MLYSEGFITAKILSKKLTGLFELMIQQLSKQVWSVSIFSCRSYVMQCRVCAVPHPWFLFYNIMTPTYLLRTITIMDFATQKGSIESGHLFKTALVWSLMFRSILVAAGALKRSDPAMQEDILLYRTIRDMQLPWVLENSFEFNNMDHPQQNRETVIERA